MQLTVLFITILFMIVISAYFIAAIRAADTSQVANAPETETRRSRLIWCLLVFGLFVTVASLWSWPHAVHKSNDHVTVNATGYQWYWEVDKETVPLGKPVVFNVHTADVTHGIGIVDPSGRILVQTQAMPGYVNRVEHVFNTTGTHKVICLEFCGIGHHSMVTELDVISE